MNQLTYDRFSILELKLKKGVQFQVKYLELRDDDNGLYDITRTEENWRFNNEKIFQLAEKLESFIPCSENEAELISVAIDSLRFSNDDETFTVKFQGISFKFSHNTIGAENKTTVSTAKIPLDSYEERFDELALLIEEINLNAYQFCVEGLEFPAEQSESQISGDEISFN